MNPSGVMRIQIIANSRQAQSQIAAVQRQVGGLNTRLGAGTIAGQRFQQVFRQGYMERWAKNLQWTGRQIEYNFTLPLAVATGFATKWYLEVESAMTRLRKVYGDHGTSAAQIAEDTEKLGQAFELLSNRFGVAQSEVADIGATWAQAGARGAQVARSTRSSLELMILGEMEAAEATRALIAIQSQYQLSTQDLRQAVADLNAVENNTATTLPDLVRVIERAGAAARNSGVDIKELAALTASLVPASGTAERAGNALRTIITRLMVPTKAARDLFREIGIEVDTAGWNSLNFRDRLFRLAKTFEGLNTAQRAAVSTQAAGVFQVSRFGTIMSDIVDPAGRYARALDATADSTQTLTDYTKEIGTYLASDPQGFKILTARLQNLLIRVITPLIPAILGIFSRVVKLAEAFAELDPRVQQIVLGLLLLVAVVGPLARYIGAIVLLGTRLGAGFSFMAKTAHVAADGLGFLLARLGLVATFPLNVIARVAQGTFGLVGASAAGAGRLMVGAFVGAHTVLVRVLSSLPRVAVAAWSGLTVFWTALWNGWIGIANAAMSLFGPLAVRMSVRVSRALMAVQAAYSSAIYGGTLALQRGLLAAQVTFSGIMARLPGMLYAAWVGVGTVANNAAEAVFKAIWYMMEGWLRFVAFVPRIHTAMWQRLVAIHRGFVPFMTMMFAPIVAAAMALPGIVSGAMQAAFIATSINYGVFAQVVTAALTRATAAARVGMMALYLALTIDVPAIFAGMGAAMVRGYRALVAGLVATTQAMRAAWLTFTVVTMPGLWTRMWIALAAIQRGAIPFIVGMWSRMWAALLVIQARATPLIIRGASALWTAFVGLPAMLARIPAAFGAVLVAFRVVMANMMLVMALWRVRALAAIGGVIRGFWLMPGAAAGAMRAVAVALGRGVMFAMGALLSWPGMILVAVGAIAVIFRDQIGAAVEWLAEKFYDLPKAASGALRMVVDFFRSVARQIMQIVRFIINPFAGFGGSSGSTPSMTQNAPDRTSGPQAMAEGGEVKGKGFRDTVPAMLSPGEFVITRTGSNLDEAIAYYDQRTNESKVSEAVTALRDARNQTAIDTVVKMARGGSVPGSGRGDTVPAMLTPGEFVVTADGSNLPDAIAYYRDRRGGSQVVETVSRISAEETENVVKMANGGLVTLQRVQHFQAGGAVEDSEMVHMRREIAAPTVTGSAVVKTNTPEVKAMDASVKNLERSVAGLEAQVKAANRAIEDEQLVLDRLQRAADATRASLDAARDSMQEWAATPIEGMRAMSDAIFENEMAQKRLRLEMLRLEEANGPIQDVKDRLNALGRDIESLYDEQATLTSMGAGGDVLGVIDKRIDAMEREYHQLENATGQADTARAQYEALETELANLQRRGEILNLEEALAFDPLTRQIDQAANSMREMPFETILANVQAQRAEVERLTPIWERQNAAVEAQQAIIDDMSLARDALQRRLEDEKGALDAVKGSYDELTGGVTDAVEAFRNLEGAQDWEIPGGTIEGLEDLEGDLDSFIADLQAEMEDEFGSLELFEPIKNAWDTAVQWLRDHASLAAGALIGGLVGGMSGLGTAVLAAITTPFAAVPAALGSFAGPLGIAIGAMLGVAVALAWDYFSNNAGWEGLQQWFDESPIGQFLQRLLPPVQEFAEKVGDLWRDFTGQFGDELAKWGPVFEQAKGAIENIASVIVQIISWLAEQFRTEGTLLNTIWTNLWAGFTHVVLPAIRMIGEIILGLFAIVRNVFGFVFALINGDWAAMWAYAGGIFTSAWDTIFALFRGIGGVLYGILRGIVHKIVGFFQWLYDTLVGNSLVPDLINAIVTWFSGLPGRIAAFVLDMVNRAIALFGQLLTNTIKKFDQIRDSIVQRINQIRESVTAWIADIRQRWSDFWQGLFTKASEVVGTILAKVKEFLGWNGGLRELISTAVTAIGNLWDRIKAKFADPINFVIRTVYNDGIRKLWNYVAEKVGLGTLAPIDEIRMKRGGEVPGVGAMDTVPALLTPGEFVVRADGTNLADAFAHFGTSAPMPSPLEASARRGGDEARRFARGGAVQSEIAAREVAKSNKLENSYRNVKALVAPSNKNVSTDFRRRTSDTTSTWDRVNEHARSATRKAAPVHFQQGGVVGDLQGLNPQFFAWLQQWSRAIRTRINVGSGYRTRAEQARLYAQKPGLAAPPGRSNHEWGLAADITPQLGGTARGRRARDFAMHFPMSYEPWHIEPINARAMRGGGGGGIMGWLMESIADLADRFLGPVREQVGEFRATGPVQNLLGAASARLMDAGVNWLRDREAAGELMAAPGGTTPRQADAAAAGTDRRSNVELGRSIAQARYGWTGGQWNSLHTLWQKESNWNHLARNPSSGAYGIPQALPANKMASHGGDWRTSPRTQILWGADYIKSRYTTPTNALQAWYSRSPHWYAAGGPVELDEITRNSGKSGPRGRGSDVVPAYLTPGEFVVDSQGSNLYEAIRYYDPRISYMATGGPVGAHTVTATAGNYSNLQASEPVQHNDNSSTENHYHFGDLNFPNVRSGDDAEMFVRNLSQLVGGER